MLNIGSRTHSVNGILKGHFGLGHEETVRKNALGTALYQGYVVEVGESIPRALLSGIGTEPMGDAKLGDLYYIKEERNELRETFVSFILARGADRIIEIISTLTISFNLQNKLFSP